MLSCYSSMNFLVLTYVLVVCFIFTSLDSFLFSVFSSYDIREWICILWLLVEFYGVIC